MKILRSAVISLAMIAASASSAYAHDSFSFGINVGGYGNPYGYAQAPVVVYPQARYYEPVRVIRYAPIAYGYQGDDHGYRGWGHEGREHHGWGRGEDRGEHRGWNRGDEGRGYGRGHGDRD